MTGSFRLRIGIISVVIGGHFGGGDHFDGGDHFGGGTLPLLIAACWCEGKNNCPCFYSRKYDGMLKYYTERDMAYS